MKSCEEIESCIKAAYPDYEHSGKRNEAVELLNKHLYQLSNIITVGHLVVVGSFLDGSPSFFMRNESFDMDLLWCLPRSAGRIEGFSNTETKELLANPIDSRNPVFFRLWVPNIPSLQDAYKEIRSKMNGKDYFSTDKIKEKAFENMPLLKQSDTPPVGKASIPFKLPIRCVVNYFKKTDNIDQESLDVFDSWFKHMDIVPAIPCQGWPSIETCQKQLIRIRNVDCKLAELLEEQGFHLVTKSKYGFEFRDAVWMVSFARAEAVLALYMDEYSRTCLSLLKLILQDLKVIQDKEEEQVDKDCMKSYYFKTIFYWWWLNRKENARKDILGESIVSLLQDCQEKLKSGVLGMFWLSDYNLFSDVKQNVLKEAEEKITKFLQTAEIDATRKKIFIPYTHRYVPIHKIYIQDDQNAMVSSYIFKEIVNFFSRLLEKPIEDPAKLSKKLINNILAGVTKLLIDLEKDDVIFRTELLQPENAVEQLLERVSSEPVMQVQIRNALALLCLLFEIVTEIFQQKMKQFNDLLRVFQAGMYFHLRF